MVADCTALVVLVAVNAGKVVVLPEAGRPMLGLLFVHVTEPTVVKVTVPTLAPLQYVVLPGNPAMPGVGLTVIVNV
jgi:hypothetical protein